MNIIDRIMDHDISPYMYEYEGKMYYEPADDPYYIDHFIFKDILDFGHDGSCSIALIYNEQDRDSALIHIYNSDGSFSSCIDIENIKYVKTEYEQSELSLEQKEELNRVMHLPCIDIFSKGDIDIYHTCIHFWHSSNKNKFGFLTKKETPNFIFLKEGGNI